MKTTTTYQAQLPLRNYRIVTPRPMPRPLRPPVLVDPRDLAENMKRKFIHLIASGFWYCDDCQATCERVEGENGQPAHCGRCGSARIKYNPPVEAKLPEVT